MTQMFSKETAMNIISSVSFQKIDENLYKLFYYEYQDLAMRLLEYYGDETRAAIAAQLWMWESYARMN